MLYLAADHRGFELKEKLKAYLQAQSVAFEDCGAFAYDETDDYTNISHALVMKMDDHPDTLGVMLCGSGGGACIALNKHKGVRAAQGFNLEEVMALRNDDDVRILALGANYITEETMYAFVDAFIKTPFGAQERYIRRIKEIRDIEQGDFSNL